MTDRIDDDTIDIQPWPVMELVGRAVVLATIARRGMLDVDDQRDVFDVETDRFDLSTWGRTELQNWLSDWEVTLLGKPVGQLSDEDLVRCDDALIGASTIAWALRVDDSAQIAMPHNDAAEEQTLSWAPVPWSKIRPLQSRVRLRSDEDLARERERWELWYWRANDASEDTSSLPEVMTEVEESGLIPVSDGDFATDDGASWSRLTSDDQDALAWIAEVRLKTLNWVCGFGSSWDAAPLYLEEFE